MNPFVRERIQRKLDTLSDERLYQILDYVEFLEAKYAERQASPVGVIKKIAEGVEDTLRAGGVAAGTISKTMGWFNNTANFVNGMAQSTMGLATDVVNAAARAADQVGSPSQPTAPNAQIAAPKPPTPPTPGNTPPGSPPEAAA